MKMSEAAQEFDEIFSVFQFEENKVKNGEVYNILRLYGYFPSNKEASEVIKKLDPSNVGYIERSVLKDTLENLHFKLKAPLDIEGMLSFLSKDGKISVKELTTALTCVGEIIPKEEIDLLLKDLTSQYGEHMPVGVIAEVLNPKDFV